MKRTNTLPLSDILRAVVDRYHLEAGLNSARIATVWKDLLGPLAASTERVQLRGKTLIVSLRSAVVRNELMMRRSDLLRRLNDRLGGDAVKEIVMR